MGKPDIAEAMELDNSVSAEDEVTNTTPADHIEPAEESPDENKGTLTTVASTYFNEKIAVPDTGGVSIKEVSAEVVIRCVFVDI